MIASIINTMLYNYAALSSIKKWKQIVINNKLAKGRVLITALRNQTWIEWGVYCSFVIKNLGYDTDLLYKKSEISTFYNSHFFNFWNEVKSSSHIKLINIEELDYELSDYDRYYSEVYKSIVDATAYNFHVESEDILENIDMYGKVLSNLQCEAAKNGARLYKHLKLNQYHQFICYSGIIADTPSLLKAALDAKQEVVCVEGWAWRPGHMIYNFGAPALEYNIRGWLNYFGQWNLDKEKEIRKYLNFLDGENPTDEWLKNFHPVQLKKKEDNLPPYLSEFLEGSSKVFLLACNVIGDSSLLNRETIFNSHKDFIRRTVDYFKLRPDLKLIIRAHPAEEWVKAKVTVKLGEYSQKLTSGISNIFVIDSCEKINTFSLLPHVNYGLVWLSSIGVDLVVRGVPVIAAAKPKYCGLGIVEEPNSIESFFNKISEFASREIKVSPEQVQAAKEYLYVVFKGFSFEAQGRTFRADSMLLNNMPNQEEHDRFYRILLKEEPAPDLLHC